MKTSIFLTAVFALGMFSAATVFAADRPNILFVFADDWGWGDLGCHGHPYARTTNIDRLAAEGTDFQRFTVASGVCSPSRTAVLTGHFPGRYRIDGHFAWVESNEARGMPDWLDPTVPTLPRFLQESGYATAHYGKWHLANDMIPDSPLPSEYGYDDYGTFNSAGPQMFVHDDVKSAIGFIEKAHEAGKPFFINLWMHESHTPHHTNPKLRELFPDLDEVNKIYASILYHADQRIGLLLDALDRLKIAEDTLVIFSSDNGPARGGKKLAIMYDSATGPGYNVYASKGITGGRREYKGSLFEGGIGVPFIARWPGKIAAGKIDNTTMISAVDLLPTFCEIANVTLPKSYHPDGVSQLGALMGDKRPNRDKPLFWKKRSAAGSDRPTYAIVHHNWKMVASTNLEKLELFDIRNDPYEAHDLKEKHPEVVKQLKKQIVNWQASLPEHANPSCFSDFRGKPSLKNTFR